MFAQCRPRSIPRMRRKAALWLSHTTPTYAYDATYATYPGHWPTRPDSRWPGRTSGTRRSRTSSVMMIAKGAQMINSLL